MGFSEPIHIQIQLQGKKPDGKLFPVPPPHALVMRGPVLQVTASLEQNATKAMLAQGKTVPTNTGFALIDTGASNTCNDEQAAQELGLPVIDVGQMQSVTHERHPCNIYPVQIASPIVTFNPPRTMGANLAVQGLLALIGRDVLAVCNLFYNGPSGQFTLSL